MRLFELFGKSKLENVINKLKENDLKPQAKLLEDGIYSRFSELRKRIECEMLKNNYNLKQPAAIESLNRFKSAKDICDEYKYIEGARFMQNYIDIYTIYLNEYCD